MGTTYPNLDLQVHQAHYDSNAALRWPGRAGVCLHTITCSKEGSLMSYRVCIGETM